MKIFTRSQLFQLFRQENELPVLMAQMIFKSMTDEDLAQGYGMKVLRKGYFYR
jgi:hypothetical protein